jgi:hypothetical protein
LSPTPLRDRAWQADTEHVGEWLSIPGFQLPKRAYVSDGIAEHFVRDERRRYRPLSVECGGMPVQPEKSFSSQDKKSWLRLADDWTKMARAAAEAGIETERATMEEPDRAKVMKRAYELWEQAGMPQGSAEKFFIRPRKSCAIKKSPIRCRRTSMKLDCPICLGTGWVCENSLKTEPCLNDENST